jgi:hypothetical protein
MHDRCTDSGAKVTKGRQETAETAEGPPRRDHSQSWTVPQLGRRETAGAQPHLDHQVVPRGIGPKLIHGGEDGGSFLYRAGSCHRRGRAQLCCSCRASVSDMQGAYLVRPVKSSSPSSSSQRRSRCTCSGVPAHLREGVHPRHQFPSSSLSYLHNLSGCKISGHLVPKVQKDTSDSLYITYPLCSHRCFRCCKSPPSGCSLLQLG